MRQHKNPGSLLQAMTVFQKNNFYPSLEKPLVHIDPNAQEVNS